MTGYARFAVLRILQATGVLLVVYCLVFLVVSVLPGDPISTRLSSPDSGFTEDEIARIIGYYGLDRPVIEQLLGSLGRALTGDLGMSLGSGRPVTDIIFGSLPSTLELAAFALVVAIVLAGGIATGAFLLPARWGGNLLRSAPALFMSVPTFLVGLLLIQWFAFELGWFQIIRDEGIKSAVLPGLTLAIALSAPIAQVLIQGLDHARAQQFATIGIAKGLSRREVFGLHLLKPAALPTLTVLGLIIGDLIGGSVITESVFARDGIGPVVDRAVRSQDLPILQGVVVLAAVAYITVNVIVDLLYPWLDPRLRRKS